MRGCYELKLFRRNARNKQHSGKFEANYTQTNCIVNIDSIDYIQIFLE